jgi:hypothetical protein
MAEEKSVLVRRKLIENNPFVDVAAYLFLEDIADKQGASGLNSYLMSLATSLAKSMPSEEYETWDQFLEALSNGESILTAFEEASTLTDNCVVTKECPFTKGWFEYTKRIGTFSKIHTDVAEYYNATVKPCTVNSMCVVHQTYRNAAAERIKVAGKRLQCAALAAVWCDGSRKIVPEEWKYILLEKAGITNTILNMILRNNADVWVVYTV